MLKIALCDFNHETVGIHTETMPLAIGLLGSHVHARHSETEIRLYKFVDEYLCDLKAGWTPDVMGLSLYSWNTHLNLHMARHTAEINPDLNVLVGGPNIPTDIRGTKEFLARYPFIDVIINKDGEIPLTKIVGDLLAGKPITQALDEKLQGCAGYNAAGELVLGGFGQKIQSLDETPSPYLNGMMDKFFQNKKYNLAPFIETNRGCPYACTFCHTSESYYTKLQWAGAARLKGELELFAKHFRGRHEIRLFLADNNFGMFAQDVAFADAIREVQEKYDWPRYIDVTTGKARPDHILMVANKLKWGMVTTSSVQSLTDEVLKNISRKNLDFKDYVRLQDKARESGKASVSEIILGLPGETKESHLETIRKLIGAKVELITPYTLMNLRGTPLYDQQTQDAKNHVFRHRIVPRQFGVYMDSLILDTEEVVVGTPTLSFDDYLYCRGFAYVLQVCYNKTSFTELLEFLRKSGVDVFDWMKNIYDELRSSDSFAAKQVREFLEETKAELWTSEEELQAYFAKPENYGKLLRRELGANLLSKYQIRAQAEGFESWLEVVTSALEKTLNVLNAGEAAASNKLIASDFKNYFLASKNIFPLFSEAQAPELFRDKEVELHFDLLTLNLGAVKSGSVLPGALTYRLYYTSEQKRIFADVSKLTGGDRSVKLQFIFNGNSSDFWANVSRPEGQDHRGRRLDTLPASEFHAA